MQIALQNQDFLANDLQTHLGWLSLKVEESLQELDGVYLGSVKCHHHWQCLIYLQKMVLLKEQAYFVDLKTLEKQIELNAQRILATIAQLAIQYWAVFGSMAFLSLAYLLKKANYVVQLSQMNYNHEVILLLNRLICVEKKEEGKEPKSQKGKKS